MKGISKYSLAAILHCLLPHLFAFKLQQNPTHSCVPLVFKGVLKFAVYVRPFLTRHFVLFAAAFFLSTASLHSDPSAYVQNDADISAALRNVSAVKVPPASDKQQNVPPVSLGLIEALKKLDAVMTWDSFFSQAIITSHSHTAFFRTAEAGRNTLVLYDNESLYNMPSPWIQNGELRFPQNFVTLLSQVFKESIQQDSSRYRIASIIIDPGHGGKDSGAAEDQKIGSKTVKVLEKEINLSVSKALYQKLKQMYPDKQLIMTRTGDTYPSLSDRVDIANNVSLKENEAIIYVSVHANFSTNKKARGYEVWYLSPDYRRDVIDNKKKDNIGILSVYNDMLEEQFDTESKLLSQMISDEFAKTFGTLIPSRGLKAEEWYVVRKAKMPSVLIELGFISNSDDAKLMIEQPDKFAESIFKGINNFVRRFETSGGFTQVTYP
ncbi:MAG: hypothetical protein Ta2B_20910 [Termitinemataceae bacterium]|nr:MAG: hypothetical protein Ta2B_20910 [Termitinemataceae bacterium]